MQLTKKFSSAILSSAHSKMAENAPIWRTDFCTVSDFHFLLAKIHVERMNEYFGTQI